MDRLNSFLDSYKIPLSLSLIGVVLLVSGGLESMPKRIDKDIPYESIITSGQINKDILVDVSGSVNTPGVYTLSFGSRVKDAVAAAGGFSDTADTVFISQKINLSAQMVDGQKLYIPKRGEKTFNYQNETALSEGNKTLISLNTATQSELEGLDGVGPVTAQKIINGRPYRSIDDLIDKKILSSSVFGKIKKEIILE